MGKSAKQIKDEISKGSFDATVALDALSRGMEKRFGGAANNVRKTWSGTTDRIKGAMRDMGSALVAPFIDPKGGGYAVEWGNMLATSIRAVIPAITRIMKGLGVTIGLVAEGINVVFMVLGKLWNALGPARKYVLGIVAAWVAWNVALVIWNALNPVGWVVLITVALLALIGFVWKFRKQIMTAIVGAWQWIRKQTAAIWAAIVGVVMTPVNKIRTGTVAAFTWVRNRTTAIWNAIRNMSRAVWSAIVSFFSSSWARLKSIAGAGANWVRDRVLGVWNQIRSRTVAIWTGLVNSIRTIFNRIVEFVKVPIRTVVNKVIRPLIWGINKLISKIGIPKIPDIALGFASGGRIPGGYGGGDRVTIKAEPGEWMLTKEQAAAIGYGRLRAMPRRPRRRPGHYLQGGEIQEGIGPRGAFDFIGKGWGAVTKAGGGIVSSFGKFLRQGVAKAFELFTKPLVKILDPLARSAHVMTAFVGKQGQRAIKGAIEFIRGKEESPADLMGGGPGVANLAKQVIQRFPGLVITSALRPGDPGYHGKGWARDLGGSVGLMNRAAAWMNQNMVQYLLEGIHNPGLSVKNYKRVPSGFWGSGTWAGHADHIHMAAAPNVGPREGSFNVGPASIRKIVDTVARSFGVGWAVNLAMGRLKQESGFNLRAVNRWDSNWRAGYPSVGIAQIIRGTFAAYSGRFRNKGPFMYGVSLDPWAQIYTMFKYSLARYGRSGLQRAWSGTQGYAQGGILREPVAGLGLHTGTRYSFGENAPRVPEAWSPLRGGNSNAQYPGGQGRQIIVNVYPQKGQSETEIAAIVSRRLRWAEQTGRA
jgi:hypothetical protein